MMWARKAHQKVRSDLFFIETIVLRPAEAVNGYTWLRTSPGKYPLTLHSVGNVPCILRLTYPWGGFHNRTHCKYGSISIFFSVLVNYWLSYIHICTHIKGSIVLVLNLNSLHQWYSSHSVNVVQWGYTGQISKFIFCLSHDTM